MLPVLLRWIGYVMSIRKAEMLMFPGENATVCFLQCWLNVWKPLHLVTWSVLTEKVIQITLRFKSYGQVPKLFFFKQVAPLFSCSLFAVTPCLPACFSSNFLHGISLSEFPVDDNRRQCLCNVCGKGNKGYVKELTTQKHMHRNSCQDNQVFF